MRETKDAPEGGLSRRVFIIGLRWGGQLVCHYIPPEPATAQAHLAAQSPDIEEAAKRLSRLAGVDLSEASEEIRQRHSMILSKEMDRLRSFPDLVEEAIRELLSSLIFMSEARVLQALGLDALKRPASSAEIRSFFGLPEDFSFEAATGDVEALPVTKLKKGELVTEQKRPANRPFKTDEERDFEGFVFLVEVKGTIRQLAKKAGNENISRREVAGCLPKTSITGDKPGDELSRRLKRCGVKDGWKNFVKAVLSGPADPANK